MDYRRLGQTELRVSALGLGCGRLGSVTQAGGNKAALRLIETAFDAGINFFDTADIYGQGTSEALLGKALKPHRDKVVIGTKAGYCLSTLGSIAKRIKPLLRRFIRFKPSLAQSIQNVRSGQKEQNFSSDYLAARIEASLRRLQTQRLDLFQLHSPPTDVLLKGDLFETLEQFKTAGKIRCYGVSCLTADDALICLKYPGLAMVQIELNLLSPAAAWRVLSARATNQPGVVGRQSLAGGLLLRSSAALGPQDCGSRAGDFENIRKRIEKLERVAAAAGCTVRQLAMQFLLQIDGLSSVLIGTTNELHLREHIEMTNRPPLSAPIMAQLQAILGFTTREPSRSAQEIVGDDARKL
jgi:aryl-alcohol dehydrogenase-like predicted oxidoreductase